MDPQVFDWRLNELIRAGYSVMQAEKLAGSHCDLHEAIELLRSGCSAELAFDIESE